MHENKGIETKNILKENGNDVGENWSQMGSKILEEIINGFTEISASSTNLLQELVDDTRKVVVEIAQRAIEVTQELIKHIEIPTISEEYKQELIEAHKLWGSYGWAITSQTTAEWVFNCKVVDKKTADNIALKQYSKQKMKEIFEEIRKCKRLKRTDFEEAVFDYENKQYKSCALVLFSLIDAILIRLQKKSELDGRGRKVGLKAVKEAERRTETDVNTEIFLTALVCTSLFSCLKKVFENGNDFKEQPDVINRNFFDHGMMTRRVSRKDCIQLFLVYYSMLELLDEIY